MRNIGEEIETARTAVARCRIRAERAGSRLEDDYALEKARNRLLTLELRQLKLAGGSLAATQAGDRAGVRHGNGGGAPSRIKSERTKHEHSCGTARERAEQAFAALSGGKERA